MVLCGITHDKASSSDEYGSYNAPAYLPGSTQAFGGPVPVGARPDARWIFSPLKGISLFVVSLVPQPHIRGGDKRFLLRRQYQVFKRGKNVKDFVKERPVGLQAVPQRERVAVDCP